jgi:hypothetical protein
LDSEYAAELFVITSNKAANIHKGMFSYKYVLSPHREHTDTSSSTQPSDLDSRAVIGTRHFLRWGEQHEKKPSDTAKPSGQKRNLFSTG